MAIVSPTLVLLVLAVFWSANALTATKESAASTKAAGSETYIEVEVSPAEGSATSALFGDCLSASRRVDVTLYSLEATDGSEFVRYVPDSTQTAFSYLQWETVPDVNSIVECADATANYEGALMFKYLAGECKVTDKSYNLNYAPACKTSQQDPVFILNSAAPDCFVPQFDVSSSTAVDPTCAYIVPTGGLGRSEIDEDVCPLDESDELFGKNSDYLSISQLADLILEFGVDGDLVIDGYWDAGNSKWKSGVTDVETSEMASGALPADVPSGSSGYLVMSAAGDFLLDEEDGDTVVNYAVCTFSTNSGDVNGGVGGGGGGGGGGGAGGGGAGGRGAGGRSEVRRGVGRAAGEGRGGSH